MDLIREVHDDSATVTSIPPLPTDEADQGHPTETDLTPPVEDKSAHSLNPSEENDGNDDQIDVLQKLATDRMAVMGLRSDAQEQGKALRRLYDQSFHDLSSLVAMLKEHTSSQATEQLTAISSLLSSAEKARRVFHRSQERLLEVEWSMKEKENKLYALYGGKQSPSVSLNGYSENPSDLPSVALPPSSDQDQHVSAFPEQGISSIQYGAPVLEGLEETIDYELKDALINSRIPSSTTLHNELNESIQMLLDSRLESKSPNLDRAEVEDISLLVRSAVDQSVRALTSPGRMPRSSDTPSAEVRPRQFDGKQTPAILSCIGSWFTGNLRDIVPTNQDPLREMVLAQEYVPMSAYTISGLPRWPAHEALRSSLTAGSRHRPEPLPDGVKTLQGMTIKNYELLALGLPVSGQLDLIKNLIGEDVRATRSSLLHNWLWGADARFDDAPNVVPTVGQTDAHTHGVQSGRLTRTTLANYSDSGGAIHQRGLPVLPVTANNINTVRSNLVVSRKSL